MGAPSNGVAGTLWGDGLGLDPGSRCGAPDASATCCDKLSLNDRLLTGVVSAVRAVSFEQFMRRH